jgi:uncharacterized protein YjbI with pentapeptide repeats
MSGVIEKGGVMNGSIESGKYRVEHAKLTGSVFVDVCLGEAEFDNVSLADTKFNNVNMSNARFNYINFTNAEITDSDISGMKIDGVLVEDMLKTYKQVTQ